jgi:hypothetical protein
MYERDIEIYGLDHLKEARILALLPKGKSNLWWRLNQSSITRDLSTNPLIKSASITPCHMYSVRCFVISIEERETGILAVFSDQVWVIGADGGYVATVAESVASERVEKLKARFALPLVYGLDRDSASPGMVRSRSLYAMRSRGRMERRLNVSVDTMKLRKGGELEVWFREYPFSVIFESSFDNPALLEEELGRFSALLHEIEGQERAIARIDMAYERAAVVTLTPEAEKARKDSDKERQKRLQQKQQAQG